MKAGPFDIDRVVESGGENLTEHPKNKHLSNNSSHNMDIYSALMLVVALTHPYVKKGSDRTMLASTISLKHVQFESQQSNLVVADFAFLELYCDLI